MVLAEDLRQAVLQAAIQGKLTERSSADTNIQNTLLEISDKRKYLDIDRKLLVSKEIDIEKVPFDVPKTWTWIRLGSICEVITKGSSPKWQGINYTENGLLFVTSENVGVEELLLSERKYVDEKFDEISPRSSLKHGDLLTNIVGASIGRTALYDLEEKANINQAVCIIRLINKEFAPYIMKYMNSNTAYKIMMEDKVETARPNISLTNISDFLIPLPPIEEQQRIIEKIDEIMTKINEYEKIEKELEALKKEFPTDMKDALLQAAMQGKLTEQLKSDGSVDELLISIHKEKEELIEQKKIKKEKPLVDIEEEEIPFDIPNNWRWVKLGDISTYGQSKEKITSNEIKSSTWVLDLEDIEKDTGQIMAKNKAEKKKIAGDKITFKKDDILYSKLRPYLLKILIAPEDGICTPELVPFRLYGDIDNYYIMYILKSPYVNYAVNSETYGMKMPRVGTQTMLNLLIPVPPIEEQQRIVERLDALLPLCKELKE